MASHSGRKSKGALTGSRDRQLKAQQFGDRLTVNKRQITKRPITFTTRRNEESILAVPLENSNVVAKSSSRASKSSTASRKNKPIKTPNENQDTSAEKADSVFENVVPDTLSKTIPEDSLAKSQSTAPKSSTTRRKYKRHETIDENHGIPIQPVDSSCETNVVVVRSKTTQITSNKVSVLSVRDGSSSDMPTVEVHDEMCTNTASVNQSTSALDQRNMNTSARAARLRTLPLSLKVVSQRKALQEKSLINNSVLVQSSKEGSSEALGSKLDANGEAGTSKSRIRLEREISSLTRSVFKQPLLNQSTENGNKLENLIHRPSSSDDCSSGKASRALTRSARTKHVAEIDVLANRSKSSVNSHEQSTETRTKFPRRTKSIEDGRQLVSLEKTSKGSRFKKTSDAHHSSRKSSQKSQESQTKRGPRQQTILSPLLQNISLCASDFAEQRDPTTRMEFNTSASVHNPEISLNTLQGDISRNPMSVSTFRKSSAVQDVIRQSTTLEVHAHRPVVSVNDRRQTTDDELFVPKSSKSVRGGVMPGGVMPKHLEHGRKNANTNKRKQLNLTDDEDDDVHVDVAGSSTAKPKRRKLSVTKELDLILPIVKQSVDDVLNDMKSNKQAKKVLKEMAKRVVTSVEEKFSEKSAMQRLKKTMSQIKSQEMTQRKQLLKKRQQLARMEDERLALDEKLKNEQVTKSFTDYLLELRNAARQISSTSDDLDDLD